MAVSYDHSTDRGDSVTSGAETGLRQLHTEEGQGLGDSTGVGGGTERAFRPSLGEEPACPLQAFGLRSHHGTHFCGPGSLCVAS